MPRSGKNNERTEQVPRGRKKLTKIEPLRPQAEHPDKLYNDLAKFPEENPYPVLRIHKDGTILYANKASEPLLKAKGSGMGQPAPDEWRRLVEEVLKSGRVAREEAKHEGRIFAFRAVPIVSNDYVNLYGTDITEQKMAEEERELTIKLLSLINSSNRMQELMKLVTVLLRDWSGCEAVGIRLQDGEDFPYFVTSGFSEEFILAETKLCSVNELGEIERDSQGRPFLECMCGNIISGRFDPTKPFFTEHGSFWTNSTTDLLTSTTETDRLAKTRNRCNAAGYESVALIPLRVVKEIFGLLQLNSKQKGRFTPEKISLLERLADNLAIGLAQRRAEQALIKEKELSEELINSSVDGIFAYDHECQYTIWNPGMERISGVRKEEALGRCAFDVFPFLKETGEDKFFYDALAGKTVVAKNRPYNVPKTKKKGFFEGHYAPLYNKEGNISGGLVIIRDITERKRAEEVLRESEERLKMALDAAELGIWDWDLVGEHIKWEGHHERLFGFKKGEFDGRLETFEKRIHPDDIAGLKAAVEKAKKERSEYSCEYRVIWPDGTLRWMSGKGRCHYDQSGRPIRMLGTVHDITERKQAEQALQASEERFRSLFEQAADAIVVINARTGEMAEFNDKAHQMLGYTRTEYAKLRLSDIEAIESKEEVAAHIDKVVRQGSDIFEAKQRKKDGTLCDVLVSSKLITVAGKPYLQAIWRDITELKKAEGTLLEYQKQLKRLASQLTLAEERERRRIAGKLHDHVSQSLALAKIKIDALRSSITTGELIQAIEEVSSTLEKAIQDTRSLTFDLSSPILYELGFEAAVAEWLNEQLREKHGIETVFQDDGLAKPLDDDIRTLLFRNVRELLINIIKHSNAHKVSVSVQRSENSIKVTIEDNGIGFVFDEVRKTSAKTAKFGLFSIRESLEQLGGRLEIETRPGAGCKVIMTAPLKV